MSKLYAIRHSIDHSILLDYEETRFQYLNVGGVYAIFKTPNWAEAVNRALKIRDNENIPVDVFILQEETQR